MILSFLVELEFYIVNKEIFLSTCKRHKLIELLFKTVIFAFFLSNAVMYGLNLMTAVLRLSIF